MGRKAAPQPLSLGQSKNLGQESASAETHPTSTPSGTKSPISPRSPFRFGQKKPGTSGGAKLTPQSPDVSPQERQQQRWQHHPQQQQQQQSEQQQDQLNDAAQYPPRSAPIQPSPVRSSSPANQAPTRLQQPQSQFQQSQGHGHGHHRQDEGKKSKSGFFHFNKASRSSDRINLHQHTESRAEAMSRDADFAPVSKQNTKYSDSSYPDHGVQKPNATLPGKSDPSLGSTSDYDSSTDQSKRGKPKALPLLARSQSIKEKTHLSPKDPLLAPIQIMEPERVHGSSGAPLKTAPLQAHDRSFRDMMSSAVRNHSADRSNREEKEHGRHHHGSGRDNGGSTFFSSLKTSSSKAATIIGKGLFGTSGRAGVPVDREPTIDDEHYTLKVLSLPLVEQARRTRISKRLEDSRDKTEFWMPAFPWRAIDYLNYKGSDVEGLYRVPGSGPQIKRWQRRFDEEGDVDLFQQEDLYDINIIGSMLKAWLRELPDELFPKVAQERIARECAGATSVPPLLVEELSNLSPFNYYLLFAITCHLSLLLAHSDKNKMDFRNLCICFQPCMKIDAFCFRFLVCEWRDCWKGCKNEARYIEEEYARFDTPPPVVMGAGGQKNGNGSTHSQAESQVESLSGTRAGTITPSNERYEDRNVSSSDSGKQSSRNGEATESKGRLRKKNTTDSTSVDTTSTISTNLTFNSERETPPRRSGELRPLSPIKPLSPLGF